MKKILLLLQLFLLVGMTYAELPAPRDFEFSYHYVLSGKSDMCNGQWVVGPEYCSCFSWSEPDLTATTAKLESYTIYCMNDDYLSVVVSGITTTSVAVLGGFVGEFWVTAVYSYPVGESGPSNIEFNETLPTGTESLITEDKKTILYDEDRQKISIAHASLVVKNKICVMESQGKKLIEEENITDLDVSFLQPGMYFVVLTDENGSKVVKKIVKSL